MRPSWIDAIRRGGCLVRIRADFVTAILETDEKVGDKRRMGVRVQLGNNNHVDLEDETVDSVWNKVSQAIGQTMPVTADISPDYPGHPDYGRKPKAA